MPTSVGLSMSELGNSAITAGSILRNGRESRGIHIASLAAILKVPVSKLEALEADNYAELSDTVFIRALAASICRSLKLDTESVLSLLPQSAVPKLIPEDRGLNTSVNEKFGQSALSPSSISANFGTASRLLLFVLITLLVASFILYIYPQDNYIELNDKSIFSINLISEILSDEESQKSAHTGNNHGQVSQNIEIIKNSSELDHSKNTISSTTENSSQPISENSNLNKNLDAATDGVLLRATGESWVQIKDASGSTVLQRNLSAGENINITTPTPLSFIIGRANVTEVVVRGKTFDILASTRDNVARFEVK